jgi:hypothetical protein
MGKTYSSLPTDPFISFGADLFSWVDQLKKNNIISSSIFAHYYTNPNKSGIVYIGETPTGNFNYYKCISPTQRALFSYCWSCEISEIKINNIPFNIDSSSNVAVFSTGERFIFIPENNADIIQNIINYSDWAKNNCKLDEHVAYKELHCNYENFKYSYFPIITITLGDYIIKLKPEDVFYYNYNSKYYRLLMVIYNKKDYWILGTPALKGKNMIFNKEENTVIFFEENKLNKRRIIIGISISGLIWLLIGLWCYRRKRKIQREQINKNFYKF